MKKYCLSLLLSVALLFAQAQDGANKAPQTGGDTQASSAATSETNKSESAEASSQNSETPSRGGAADSESLSDSKSGSPTAKAGEVLADTTLPKGAKPAPENPNTARVNNSAKDDLQGPFFFVEETPMQILQTLEALMDKPILVTQKNLPNIKLTFVTKRKMSREDAITALKTFLSVNGIAVFANDDKFLRAAPTVGISTQGCPFLTGDILKMPPSQDFYTHLFELEYVEPWPFIEQITTFMSRDGVSSYNLLSRSNCVLMTDTLTNLQKMERIRRRIDVPVGMREEIVFIPLQNISASDAKEKLLGLQKNVFAKYFGNTAIEVDSRANQLIIATRKENLETIRKFVEGIDVESSASLKSEVFYIRHCKPWEVENVLMRIIQHQRNQAWSNRWFRQQAIRDSIYAAQVRAHGQREVSVDAARVSTDGSATSDIEFSSYLQVVSHEKSSSIVVYGTENDLRQVAAIIKKLDIAIEQVKIDVIITEVTLSDAQVSGLSSFGIGYNIPGSTSFNKNGFDFGKANQVSVVGSSGAIPGATDKNSAFSLGVNEGALQAVFDVARENSNVKVLSSPTIVTTHSLLAEVNISDQYLIVKASTTSLTNTDNVRTEIDKQDVGIKLEVTPFVGNDGMIQMDIRQSVDSVARYMEIDGTQQPIISKRYARSTLSAKDGEIIVLAGLQHTEVNDTEGSVWLLGDLPLIGRLFQPDSSLTKRRELIIFIRPTVVKSMSAEAAAGTDRIKDSYVEKEVQNFLKKGRFYDEKQLNANFDEFEKNRFYNKLVNDPAGLVTGERRIVENSTSDIANKELEARRAKAECGAQSADEPGDAAEGEASDESLKEPQNSAQPLEASQISAPLGDNSQAAGGLSEKAKTSGGSSDMGDGEQNSNDEGKPDISGAEAASKGVEK